MATPSIEPGQVVTLQQTYEADATSVTVGITDNLGNTALAPTAAGVAHPSTGVYVFSWAVPADAEPGTYNGVWTADFSGTPSLTITPFAVAPAGGSAWCALADIPALTGQPTPEAGDLTAAQAMTEALIHRVWRPTDTGKRDYYWLQRAVAWQAVYVAAHPEVLTMMDVASMSQDGISVTFRSGAQPAQLFSPVAMRFLNALYRGSNTTIRMNSAFQKGRPLRGQIPPGRSSVTWTRL